jgi:hypothetical protein
MFMLKKYALLLCLATQMIPALYGQASATASKVFDIQIGGSFVGAYSPVNHPLPLPYTQQTLPSKYLGYGIYSTIDFLPHIGLMLNFNQVYAKSPQIEYERTYEIGGRYYIRHGRFQPYLKGMYGRGVYNFPPYPNDPTGPASANIAYNLLGLGGGVDIRLMTYLNLRGDYEWQKWFAGQVLTNGITPQLFTVGVAYHFR